MSRPDAQALAAIRPVVVMGMHRSGTTLVARLLRELGVHMGRRRGHNEEALYFQRLNEWLLRRAGGAWDRPLPFADAVADDALRDMAVAKMVSAFGDADLGDFTGRRFGLIDRGLLERQPWGFKDPRVCFTLPVWQQVFPQLRLIHIRRHGVDVAASLQRRALEDEPRSPIRVYGTAPLRTRLAWARSRFERHINHSVRCRQLQGAYALWEEYVTASEAHFDAFEGVKVAFAYEDFLAEPMAWMPRLLEVAGISPTEEAVAAAVRQVDAGKAFGFQRDPALAEFSETVRERPCMRQLGYDQILRRAGSASATGTASA